MTRLRRRAAVVILALGALAVVAAGGARIATASNPPPCPPGMTCTGSTTITDTTVNAQGQPSMGAAFMTQDPLGNPMGWIDGFQMGSANPVCAVAIKTATTYDFERMACLGGPPFDATGGHPVLALWDGRRWQVLTPADVALLNALRQAGLTVRDLRVLAAWAHAREARP